MICTSIKNYPDNPIIVYSGLQCILNLLNNKNKKEIFMIISENDNLEEINEMQE